MSLRIDHGLLLQSAHQLPPLPQSAARLIHLLANDESDLAEIVGVIEFDPPLTMKLLRVANSAMAGSRYRLGTVREALLRLGTGMVAGFVAGSCVLPLMAKTIPGYGITRDDFWRHSLAAAFAADIVQSQAARGSNPLAFTAALLHDVGKLVLGKCLTPEMLAWLERAVWEGKQSGAKAEMDILSVHHGEVGGIIAQHWGLPEPLVKGIIYHHSPDEEGSGICYVTCLANAVAHSLEYPGSADRQLHLMAPADLAFVLECLGLAEEDLAKIHEEVGKNLQAVVDQFS